MTLEEAVQRIDLSLRTVAAWEEMERRVDNPKEALHRVHGELGALREIEQKHPVLVSRIVPLTQRLTGLAERIKLGL